MSGRRTGTLLITLVLTTLTLGCGGSAETEVADQTGARASREQEQSPSASYTTPQDTFQTARAAMVHEDFAAFVDCFSPDGLAEMAGTLRLLSGLLHSMGNVEGAQPNAVALAKAVEAAVNAYQQPDAPQVNLDLNLSEEELRAQIREAGGAFSDQRAFVVAMFEALAEHGDKRPDSSAFEAAQLENLTVDGDRAKGTISVGFLDGQPTPVVFRELDDGWKIDALGKIGVSP